MSLSQKKNLITEVLVRKETCAYQNFLTLSWSDAPSSQLNFRTWRVRHQNQLQMPSELEIASKESAAECRHKKHIRRNHIGKRCCLLKMTILLARRCLHSNTSSRRQWDNALTFLLTERSIAITAITTAAIAIAQIIAPHHSRGITVIVWTHRWDNSPLPTGKSTPNEQNGRRDGNGWNGRWRIVCTE